MQKAFDFLAGLFGKLIDTLDNLEVVDGVSLLVFFLGVFIILTVIGVTFGSGGDRE